MILVRRVGVSNDAGPAAATHQHRRIPADTAGQAIHHSLRHFPGFVYPGTGQLHRQQLGNVVRPIERNEQHFHVQVAFNDVMRRRSGIDPAAQVRRHPLMPALDRGGAQLWIGISDDSPTSFALAVDVDPLLFGATQDLHDAGRRLARSKRTHQATKECVRQHESSGHRAWRPIGDLRCGQALCLLGHSAQA